MTNEITKTNATQTDVLNLMLATAKTQVEGVGRVQYVKDFKIIDRGFTDSDGNEFERSYVVGTDGVSGNPVYREIHTTSFNNAEYAVCVKCYKKASKGVEYEHCSGSRKLGKQAFELGVQRELDRMIYGEDDSDNTPV